MAKDTIDKEVGYSCSYVPLEILDSFGIKANYVIGDGSSPDTSQGYLSQNICGFAKAICSRPRDQVYDMILTDCFEAMVKLYESFNLHADFKDDFTYLLTVPRSYEKLHIEYWPKVLGHFIQTLEKATGEAFSETRLADSIRKFNKFRNLLRHLERMLLQNTIWGSEYVKLLFSLHDPGVEESIAVTEDFVESNRDNEEIDVEYSILVTGSNMPAALSLAEHFEQYDRNARFFDNCNLARFYNMEVSQSISPLESISEAYLKKPPCPRMKHSTPRMLNLIQLIKQYELDLAIYHTVKFCATHIYDYLSFKELCKKNDIPLVRIETNHEYDLPGQAATRLEAALEMF